MRSPRDLKNKPDNKDEDPFFALKYIAWCRTQLPPEEAELEEIDFVHYAKWSICRERGILFKDPVWDGYTPEDIMVEFFAIGFDNSEEIRDAFQSSMKGVKAADIDWFEAMEKKVLAEKEAEAKKLMDGKDEIEDSF